ncbi:iron ABC transporter permease [Kocuria rosea]|uniref:ABC transporter permease n=1 Tax=Kocuria TaxID=57493 RepID=UPI000D64992B|nr:iron ABC transporter permease [Kocuria rosea]PWF84494.1 iron ABC transporter permease [Kocuria rosea]THE19353.1 iron ABC transporter permease [Kocuria rosea]
MVALVPLFYILVRTGQGGVGAWWELVTTERTARLAATSLALALVVTAGSLVLGVGSAYLVTRTNVPFRRGFAVLAALPLAVPSYVAAYTWVSVADLWSSAARFEGFGAAVVVLTLYTYPYVYLPVAAAFAGADVAQEEVARSLGRGPWRTLTTVSLPQVRPAIAGGGLLAILYILSDFGAVSILRVDTFTRAIFTAFSAGFDRATALSLSTILVLLTVLVLTLEGRTRRRDARYESAGAGRATSTLDLGRSRWAAAAVLTATALLALGVPAVSMLRWMTAGTSRADSWGQVLTAAAGSLTVSLAGALLTMVLALPIGILAARHPGRLSALTERAAYLAHSLPGVVVGLSLVFLGVTVLMPLYQTTWLLAFAYATLFLPLGVAAVTGAAAQAPPALEEVGTSLGRSPAQVFRSVTLPLTLPGIGAGAALVFLTCMKELPATLMLRPTGLDTLATELWQATSYQRYAEAAPYAFLLVLLATIPTWALVRRSGVVTTTRTRTPARILDEELIIHD